MQITIQIVQTLCKNMVMITLQYHDQSHYNNSLRSSAADFGDK